MKIDRMPGPFYFIAFNNAYIRTGGALITTKSLLLSFKWHVPMKATGSGFLNRAIP